jgi:hypothetical protein
MRFSSIDKIVVAACWKKLCREIELRFSSHQGWSTVEIAGNGGRFLSPTGMRTICSVDEELDGDYWIHVSCSYTDRVPTYAEMKEAHEVLIGDERTSYQLFVPKKDHINCHEYCLHLWAKYDGGAVTPDFTRGEGAI